MRGDKELFLAGDRFTPDVAGSPRSPHEITARRRLLGGYLGPLVPPCPCPGLSFDRPGGGVAVTGAEVVGASAVGDPVEGFFVVVPAGAEPLAEGDGAADAESDDSPVPDGPSARAASDADARPGSLGAADSSDSPVVAPVRSPLPWVPDGDPEKENPAISAAA
ncbi:hypothetical protein [Streptomyces sp. KR55]|uniref:hypothetical protein n=1 Tax=Streptomyces sp. KR55 TaxID=3457425 RepID=UPI003FD51C78